MVFLVVFFNVVLNVKVRFEFVLELSVVLFVREFLSKRYLLLKREFSLFNVDKYVNKIMNLGVLIYVIDVFYFNYIVIWIGFDVWKDYIYLEFKKLIVFLEIIIY